MKTIPYDHSFLPSAFVSVTDVGFVSANSLATEYGRDISRQKTKSMTGMLTPWSWPTMARFRSYPSRSLFVADARMSASNRAGSCLPVLGWLRL